MMIKPSNQ
ncbi:Protein of unknown function [Lactobacillus delbrueckii subsp. lactis]|nr:Protein of unknown function [Lactobacillus delbrueckii subsp. lactis]